MVGMDLDLEAHATVMAELAAAGPARAEVLARRGLDEDPWHAPPRSAGFRTHFAAMND
jgi:hypothetical protein